jgi:hypothetical protein
MATGTPGETYDTRIRRPAVPVRSELDETKASFQSTELWVCVAAVIGVLAATAQLDNMDAWDGWRLVTALAIGYMLSRGLAKAGSSHRDEG